MILLLLLVIILALAGAEAVATESQARLRHDKGQLEEHVRQALHGSSQRLKITHVKSSMGPPRIPAESPHVSRVLEAFLW